MEIVDQVIEGLGWSWPELVAALAHGERAERAASASDTRGPGAPTVRNSMAQGETARAGDPRSWPARDREQAISALTTSRAASGGNPLAIGERLVSRLRRATLLRRAG